MVPWLVVLIIISLVWLLVHSQTGDGQGNAKDGNANEAEDFHLRIAQPWHIFDQVHKADKVSNDLGRITHACAPGVGQFLLPQGWNIKDQGSTNGLDRVQCKVQKVK